ncbi:MAG: NAD(P)H-binding protein [Muribaculaceae bacterium]|nr:NAD(P)H-binding protein [Muribaculaceae bacterium]
MKEIALAGINGHVLSDVLSGLLHRGAAVNAIVTNPEHLMIENTALTISHLNTQTKETLTEGFEGYNTVILAFGDDQTDKEANDFTLKYYNELVNAVREAGASRLIVVGGYNSEAFFVTDLRRRDDIDWVYISTEGDYSTRAAEEALQPSRHHEVYK